MYIYIYIYIYVDIKNIFSKIQTDNPKNSVANGK